MIGKLANGFMSLGEALLDLCLPGRCAGCREAWLASHEGFWCEKCLRELPWIQSPLCPCCGRPFPDSPTSDDHFCGDCSRSEFPFDTARSAVQHAGVVRERIHQLKFGAQLHWVPPLTELLAMVLHHGREVYGIGADVIVPVPLHVRRLKQRGFNQAGLIAKKLARRTGLPVSFDALVRKSWTDPQTRLNRQERLVNVKGAFEVARPEEVRDRRIVLVDDVFTTGTTLSECSRTLKDAGASEVHAMTVTRALAELFTAETPRAQRKRREIT